MAIFSFTGGQLPAQSTSDRVEAIKTAADDMFLRLPMVKISASLDEQCGATDQTNKDILYCTTSNIIWLADAAADLPETGYILAHAFGHAIQVKHGIADHALAQIRARRDEETYLRGLVTRQVECLAGMIYARAGFAQANLHDWFDQEPFTDSHWGRDPLAIGPQVTIGLAARDEWFQLGQMQQSPAGCAVGELFADPLIAAFRG